VRPWTSTIAPRGAAGTRDHSESAWPSSARIVVCSRGATPIARAEPCNGATTTAGVGPRQAAKNPNTETIHTGAATGPGCRRPNATVEGGGGNLGGGRGNRFQWGERALMPNTRIRAGRRAWLLAATITTACTIDMDNVPVGKPAGLGGSVGDGGDGGEDGGGDDGTADAAPADRVQLRRLTRSQYGRTVVQLMGEGIVVPAALPADALDHHYSTVGTAGLTVGGFDVEQFENAAGDLADQVIDDPTRRDTVVGCDAAVVTCLEDFVARFGRRAFRRTLTDDERSRYVALGTAIATRFEDPWRGIHGVMIGLLASPNFLYITDIGESDPDDPERRRYTSVEMASRLAFFLWGHGPDDELLDRAEAGELADGDGVAEIAGQMLDHPSARGGLGRFFGEWLAVEAVGTQAKDAAVYPTATPELFASMAQEIERMVEHVVFDQGESMLALLDTRTAFVDDRLAAIYGMPTTGGPMAAVERDQDDPRAGLLGTAGVLSLTSRRARTAPTLRGIFVQQRFRCVDLPPPPPDVDVEIPDDPAGDGSPQTMRQLLEEHDVNPACATCHKLVDPVGLALEHFDPLGAWRNDDHGLTIDDSGVLDQAEFHGMAELVTLLRSDPVVEACMVRQLYRYATGHVEDDAVDGPAIDALATVFADVDGELSQFVPALVSSTAFRTFAEVE
jgi:Protein of unknown function (DUF1592)/Protein of unknown function (DUF1588)/Protein of unknown function (DUF1595)/Protein of unknown function (DUF1585)/Protein of unknown function (DUF1587)